MSLEDRVAHLESEVARLRGTLGSICLVIDYSGHGKTRKIASVSPGTDEAFHFLATYCIDLARKLDYVFLATAPYAMEATRALVDRVQDDNAVVYANHPNGSSLTWEETSARVDDVFYELIQEVIPQHEALLREYYGREERPGSKP